MLNTTDMLSAKRRGVQMHSLILDPLFNIMHVMRTKTKVTWTWTCICVGNSNAEQRKTALNIDLEKKKY